MMKKEGKKKPGAPVVFLVIIAVFALCWLISWIQVTERVEFDLLAGDESTVRIVLITDLHSCYYGKDQKWLLDAIDKEKPDIIMISGDFFDDVLDNTNSKITAEYLAERYPCYYVTGNHEFWSGRADEMKRFMRDIGVNVLEGDCKTAVVNGTEIDICGVDDPTDIGMNSWNEQLKKAYSQTDDQHIKVLLSHRPEKVREYEGYDFDLILSGHAHAGQILIPFINRGVFAPDQGFMAEYVNGAYRLSNGSIMEVSRGLGRESTPAPRFFNHPEIVVIDIH